jgi:DNA-directed RNA polymerase
MGRWLLKRQTMNNIKEAAQARETKRESLNLSYIPVVPDVSPHAAEHVRAFRAAGMDALVNRQLRREASSSRKVSTEHALTMFATDFNRDALNTGIEAFRNRLETASVTKTGLVQNIKHGGYSRNPVNSLSVDQQVRATWEGVVSMAGRMANKDQPTSVQAMGAEIGERLRQMTGNAEPNTTFGYEAAALTLLKYFELATQWVSEDDGGHELTGKKLKPNTVSFTDKFRDEVCGGGVSIDFSENKPMLVRPVDWTETATRGGYLSKSIPPIRRSKKPIQARAIVSALNAMQATPFRVNKRVLAMAETFPNFADAPPTKRILGKVLDVRHDLTETEIRAQAMRSALTIAAMRELQDEEEFYFPWNLDWRGRMYPATSIISPQGADLCKGCLEFADGTEIGTIGAGGGFALRWQLCNLAGADKKAIDGINGPEYRTLTPGERAAWADDHTNIILAVAADPEANRDWHLTENRFGLTKIKRGKIVPAAIDKPWQFLAACFEWAGYKAQGAAFVSHLPASLDGSCSGVQMLSGMTRDESAGKMVNLTHTLRGDDYYGRMAAALNARLLSLVDTADERTTAHLAYWSGQTIDRDLLKAPSMTKVYSAGTYTFAEQLHAKINAPVDACLWLASQIDRCFADVAPGVLQAMRYLQCVADVMTKAGKETVWTTPAGLKVAQAAYGTCKPYKVRTMVDGTQWDRSFVVASNTLDSGKQKAGVSPNFVHGVDAAHMVMVVNDLVRKGVTSLWMVHDSFGVPFRDRGLAYDSTRAEFGRLMSGNLLRDWTDEVTAGLTDEQRGKLPALPERGQLDVDEVKKSWFAWA